MCELESVVHSNPLLTSPLHKGEEPDWYANPPEHQGEEPDWYANPPEHQGEGKD